MKQSKLLEGAEEQHALPTPPERDGGKPRLRVAVRDQIIVRAFTGDCPNFRGAGDVALGKCFIAAKMGLSPWSRPMNGYEKKKLEQGKDPFLPQVGDTPAVAEWRQRMGTPEAKQIYRQRAATAEWVNAQARNRGLQQFRVRGLNKVRIIAVWYALAHNVLRMAALRAAVKDKES